MGKVPHKMGGQYKKNGIQVWDKKNFERYILLESTRGPTVEHSPGT